MAILPFLHFSLEWQKKEKGNKILEKGLGYKSTVWAQKTGINRRKNISYICIYYYFIYIYIYVYNSFQGSLAGCYKHLILDTLAGGLTRTPTKGQQKYALSILAKNVGGCTCPRETIFFPPEALSKSISKLEIACGGAVFPSSLTSAPCGSARPVCFCFSQARSLTRLPTHRQPLPRAVTYASSELPGTSRWPTSLDFKASETRVFPSRLAQNRDDMVGPGLGSLRIE